MWSWTKKVPQGPARGALYRIVPVTCAAVQPSAMKCRGLAYSVRVGQSGVVLPGLAEAWAASNEWPRGWQLHSRA
jgi:hypothetical protein